MQETTPQNNRSAPSPIPSLPAERKTLGQEINAATRQVHSELNGLIIARLPLALPPHTTSPCLYATGIWPFAQVYGVFESEWCSIVDGDRWHGSKDAVSAPHSDGGYYSEDEVTCKVESSMRIRRLLSTIPVGILRRSQRLDHDMEYLTELPNVQTTMWEESHYPYLRPFLNHIERAVRSKPHVIITYLWIFYMALFSGGRWIRSQLRSAGPHFWKDEGLYCSHDRWSPLVKALGLPIPYFLRQRDKRQWPGLDFFHFDGNEDGEDCKRLFKDSILSLEQDLTFEERADIVEEASVIFRYCIALVKDLDTLLGTEGVSDSKSTITNLSASRLHAVGKIQSSSNDSHVPKMTIAKLKVTSDQVWASMRGISVSYVGPKGVRRRFTTTIFCLVMGLWVWTMFSDNEFPLIV